MLPGQTRGSERTSPAAAAARISCGLCLGFVSVVFRCCLGVVSLVWTLSRFCLGVVSVLSRCCLAPPPPNSLSPNGWRYRYIYIFFHYLSIYLYLYELIYINK